MRLSNLFIFSSLLIVLSCSIGFLIYKSFGESDSASGSSQQDLAAQIEDLKSKYQKLVKESARTLKESTRKIRSLENDLARATDLSTAKDQEITRLANLIDKGPLGAISKKLKCSPEKSIEAVDQLVRDRQVLQARLQQLNQELALKSDASKKTASIDGTADRAGHVQMEEPNNGTSADHAPDVPRNGSNGIFPSVGKNQPKGSETVPDPESEPVPRIELARQIKQLESELQNREKLLREQISLIEQLKARTGTRETGLRTENRTSGSSSPTTAAQPFLDRGTFRAPIRRTVGSQQ